MTESELTENYIRLREENKSLNNQIEAYKQVLETIAKGMTVNPPNGQAEAVVGYFVGFAEAVLKEKP